MCGFSGIFSANKLELSDREELYKMTRLLYHRGPDGYGYHFDSDEGLAMGHARLSIIDLESGHQPIFSPDRQCVLTVNGELYDYKRIRTELALDGVHFATKSDSEIAIHLYRKYGLSFIDELRGEFAFSLYDKRNQTMILGRDRYGIKPLYYTIKNDTVYYGSEIKSILQHQKITAEFDKKTVMHQMMHTMVPGTTMFKDIYALKPGFMLILKKENGQLNISEKRYWDIEFPEENAYSDQKPEEYIKRSQELLTEAVQHRLEADVPVGAYLSGGIDSCTMLGLATNMQQSPVKAYTISFDHDSYDESKIAKEMAARTRADHEILNLKSEDLYGENYINTLWHAERCFYNTLGVAKYCMSRRVKESGYKVVITGEGSDEIFAGYAQLKRDYFRFNGEDLSALNKSNKIFQGAILSAEDVSHPDFDELYGFTPSWIQPWMITLGHAKPLLSDEILSELSNYDPVSAIAKEVYTENLKNRSALDIAQYTWSKTMLECQILNWGGDRVDMANSMESRPAFLDHKLTEYAYTIPPKYRIHNGIEKWVLREGMKHILPETLYKREKFAFMAPPSHTEEKKQNAVNELIHSFMSKEQIRNVAMFDENRVAEFIDAYRNDTDDTSRVRKDAILNHLLGVHILHHHFIK